MDIREYIRACRRLGIDQNNAIDLWKSSNSTKSPGDLNNDINVIRAANLQSKTMDTSGGRSSTSEVKPLNANQIFTQLFSAQQQKYMPSLSEEMVNVNDINKIFFDNENKLRSIGDIITGAINSAVESLELYFKQQSALLNMVNEKAGMTGEYAKNFREELTTANPRLIQLGIGFDELADSAVNLVNQSGKFATINADTWTRAGAVARAYVGTLQNLVSMYPEFEKVGLGAADAQERIGEAGKAALSLGLQAQKATKDLSTNLGRLNEFGFKNGIEGLAAMVRKATEFRMEMSNVFTIADKVMNPEGAIELSANLQVLGGAIGDFNDPLKLMYMSTNNVEGLQDALIGAAGSLATYNEEQGRFEVTGINLRKAKAMASELGISMGELNKIAIASAERTQASSALMARGLTLSDEQKEFITNISQMKGGKMTIELNSEKLQKEFGAKEVALENLTQEQLTRLTQFQEEFVKLSDEEIVRKQATDIENMARDVTAIKQKVAAEAGVLVQDQVSTLIKKLTGKERLEEITGPLAKDYILNLSGKGQEFSDEIKKKVSEMYNFINPTKKTPEPTTTEQKSETKKTPLKTSKKETTTETAKTDLSNIDLSFTNDMSTYLASLNTKQDGLFSNTFNTAQNTLNTSNNISNLNGLFLNYLNTNAALNKTPDFKSVKTLVNTLMDDYARLTSNIKPMDIGDKIIERPRTVETPEKREIEHTHNVKITLQANNGQMDRAVRALFESPELEGKLTDSLSYLSEKYV